MLRKLEIQQKIYGPEHPDVALSLSALAGLYKSQLQYAKAEPFFEQALAIWAKCTSPEKTDT